MTKHTDVMLSPELEGIEAWWDANYFMPLLINDTRKNDIILLIPSECYLRSLVDQNND